eukprot:1241633-Rhodomonas_salina.1
MRLLRSARLASRRSAMSSHATCHPPDLISHSQESVGLPRTDHHHHDEDQGRSERRPQQPQRQTRQ